MRRDLIRPILLIWFFTTEQVSMNWGLVALLVKWSEYVVTLENTNNKSFQDRVKLRFRWTL